MDAREERRRFCLELAVKHSKAGASEVEAAAREYERFLTEPEAKPEAETPPAEPQGKRVRAKPAGNPEPLP